MLKTMTQLLQQTVERLRALPEEEQNRIALALQKQLDRIAGKRGQRRKRVAGLGEGTFEVPDDFTAPLSDDFWLGKT